MTNDKKFTHTNIYLGNIKPFLPNQVLIDNIENTETFQGIKNEYEKIITAAERLHVNNNDNDNNDE